MKKMVLLWVGSLLVAMGALGEVASTSLYYSVDIGGDLELSDPFADGDEHMDPGDIYTTDLLKTKEMLKDDLTIFQVDPAPPTGAPVGHHEAEWMEYVGMFFDMDGEDQLGNGFEEISEEGSPLGIPMTPSKGLYLNPPNMLLSFDDDGAPGWYADDVPVNATPDHGGDDMEILISSGWLKWPSISGFSDETTMGLVTNPVPQPEDDDVDALDTQSLKYWYWTSDHEAHYNTDPGHIYVTDRGIGGYSIAVHKGALGFFMLENQDVDIDAFEFCVTDDLGLIQNAGLPPGMYLIVLFSVDQDDPVTPQDESGGLDPNQIYYSFFKNQSFPLPNARWEEDVDALALEVNALDFGDAPDPMYPTLRLNNGARHVIVDGVHLGRTIDKEKDGQPNPMATGDDGAGSVPDDEDGVVFPSVQWYDDTLNSVWVEASTNGFLNAWVDYNANGSWADVGEQVFVDQALTSGVNYLSVQVPPGAAAPFGTCARFRFATYPGLGYTGRATDGEVEDYELVILPQEQAEGMDFGDAEVIYPVLMPFGARHNIGSGAVLGALIDPEMDGQPSPDAMMDDLDLSDDEDGVALTNALVVGSNTTIDVVASGPTFLSAWIDFNHDFDWQDSGEKVVSSRLLSAGPNTVSVSVPASAQVGETFARFRCTAASGSIHEGGFLPDGEVEDYLVTISQSLPSGYSLSITNITVTQVTTNTVVDLWWDGPANAQYDVIEQIDSLTNAQENWTSLIYPPVVTQHWQIIYSPATTNRGYYRVTIPYVAP